MNPCPKCGAPLRVDTGSILDFEEGLIDDPIFFCTNCGYDSSLLTPFQAPQGLEAN